MNTRFAKDAFGWGFLLWFFGYMLGIVLFAAVPASMIGWIITPIGSALTVWVLWKKVGADSFRQYLRLSVAWTVMAIACDFIFLVSLFKPADGYYKPDVYLYYALTFAFPLLVGWCKVSAGR